MPLYMLLPAPEHAGVLGLILVGKRGLFCA